MTFSIPPFVPMPGMHKVYITKCNKYFTNIWSVSLQIFGRTSLENNGSKTPLVETLIAHGRSGLFRARHFHS
jgi:hypothetical protein